MSKKIIEFPEQHMTPRRREYMVYACEEIIKVLKENKQHCIQMQHKFKDSFTKSDFFEDLTELFDEMINDVHEGRASYEQQTGYYRPDFIKDEFNGIVQ